MGTAPRQRSARKSMPLRERLKRSRGLTPQSSSNARWNLRASLRALGQAVLVIALVLGIAETAVRKFGPTPGDSGFREFEPHPTMFWRLRSNLNAALLAEGSTFQVRSNSVGLRNDEIPFVKAPDGYRILCLGDSITYGYGVQQDETSEARLQAALRQRYPTRWVEVINGGCPGYSSYQGLEMLKRIGLQYNPDLLVIGFIYADPATEAASDRQRADMPLAGLRELLYQSRLYLHLRGSALAGSMPTGPKDVASERVPRVPPDDFRANLLAFAEIMAKRQGRVIYLNLAKKPDMPNAEKWLDPHQERYDKYRATIREVARETGNTYIDFDSQLKSDARYFIDPIHPNAEGFRVMADTLARRIIEEGWVH
jgi:lysophospholipase L1-like esterase